MDQLLQAPSSTFWLLAGAALAGTLVLVAVVRRARRAGGERSSGDGPEPGGLPRAPRGLEPLAAAPGDELADAVRRSGAPQERYYVAQLPSGDAIALGHTPRHPWVDVFVRRRRSSDPEGIPTGPYEVFSYSLAEGRWSYGAAPPVRREVEAIIREAFLDRLAPDGRV